MAIHILYGVGIYGALKRKDTSLDQLRTLREHARAVVSAQGDLKGGLKKLEAEIRRREKRARKK
jgi:hypothetical protein